MTSKKFITWISEDKKKKYVGEMKDGVQHGLGTFTWVGLGEMGLGGGGQHFKAVPKGI